MKKWEIMLGALAISALVGCKPTDDRVPKVTAQSTTGSAAVVKEVQATNTEGAIQAALAKRLRELDTTMADLKARAQNAGEKAKAEWESRRPQLEAQRNAAAKKLDELGQSSKEAWTETRTKTEAAFAELEKGFKEAWARLKE